MKVYRSLADINIDFETSVALGNFDGVHIGHQKILKTAVQMAEALEVKPACFTFSNHPRELFGKSGSSILFITNDDEKLQLFEDAGIEVVFDVLFDEVTMNMLPEVFIKEILCDKLKAKGVSCGFNYRFGTRASGDNQLLLELGNRYGYETSIIQPVKVGSEIVSSTAIRIYIEAGDIIKANEFLGRPFSIFGAVVRGNHIGSKIGFPTANIELSFNKVSPMNGVYFTRTSVDGSTYNSVSNVGTKPTIGDYDKSIETHIFGINEELYGREIKIEFLKLHRPEVKFETVELLTEHIADDVESARRFHGVKKL
ncbi:bifunctional riboflavin kinase/FAD synthetase [Mogibacterium pumilum]|uniref:Riboflavin biosynthesis protein n=1 Tax=Mogibacterium pumilum TaxID=86332 RepID=A0A223AT04_9FIRM|nr:bifunctional riboflavin kinase/FAD synthetase [Mogibacterium pumilum]ASS38107.1 riboflavin biosynthesis protein RibF [Mogibacterium pumilum]